MHVFHYYKKVETGKNVEFFIFGESKNKKRTKVSVHRAIDIEQKKS